MFEGAIVKRCYIITPLADAEALGRYPPQKGDTLLCADGGYVKAKAFGLSPDMVLGDFDSVDILSIVGCATRRVPAEKDETDTFLCLQEGMGRGYTQFLIIGGLGGRSDHTLANIQLMAWGLERNLQIRCVSALEEAFMLAPGEHEIAKVENAYLSFFAHTEAVTGLKLKGVQYPLDGITLDNRYALCVSNRFAGPFAEVSFLTGTLLCIISRNL